MTVNTNARVAGATFLVYIAAGITDMALSTGPLVDVILSFTQCFSALLLGATLYAITRGEDQDLAMIGMICRIVEGVLGAMFISLSFAVRSLATAPSDAPDAVTMQAIRSFVRTAHGLNVSVAGWFFAMGSTMFCYLLFRGRLIPVGLAGLGVVASIVVAVGLPLRLAGVLRNPTAEIAMWLPMLAFEVPAGLWLLAKGVNTARRADVGR